MKRLVVFDLDYTLINGNSSVGFCRYLVRKRVLSRWKLLYAAMMYVRHRFLGLSLEKLHHAVFESTLKGKALTLLEQYVEPFVLEYLPQAINWVAFTRLKLAQHLGDYTAILSNSPTFLVAEIAKWFGVDDWRATSYVINPSCRLVAIEQIWNGSQKAEYVRQAMEMHTLSLAQVTAYSDSICDLPLLQQVGEPVVVNPDRALKRWAREQRWEAL